MSMESVEMCSIKGGKIRASGMAAQTGFGVIRDGEYDGTPCQCKWFSKEELARTGCKKALYENLKHHLEREPLGPWFLWPADLSLWQGSFGYVLNGDLKNYLSLGDFMEGKGAYESWSSIVNAALNLVSAFTSLNHDQHRFLHMAEDDIFIHPKTGQLLIGNVEFAAGDNALWKPVFASRLIPPCGVMGKPTSYQSWNRHMLAVLLFELLYLNHPLEGCRAAAYPVMDGKVKRIIYGSEPCFVQDPEDDSNRPVRGIHANLLRRWEMYPDYIRKLFFSAFSKAALKGRDPGIPCEKWYYAFMKFRSYIIPCPFCGTENIWKGGAKCRKCKKLLAPPAVYYHVDEESYPVLPGGVICQDQLKSQEDSGMPGFSRAEVGRFIKAKNNPSACLLQNTTGEKWAIQDQKGNASVLGPKEAVALADGMSIMVQGKVITLHSKNI